MARLVRHPPALRAAAEAMLLRGRLGPGEVSRRCGLPLSTVGDWHRQMRRRAVRPDPISADPASEALRVPNWTTRQRTALTRLLLVRDLDPRDLGQALGLRRGAAIRVFERAGVRSGPALRGGTGLPDPDVLAASLRGHAARQIAAFDARLAGAAPDTDSARVLRDLAGLRRLIADLDRDFRRERGTVPDASGREGAEAGEGDAGDADLATRRARLAERLAAFRADDLAERLSRGAEPPRPDEPGARLADPGAR